MSKDLTAFLQVTKNGKKHFIGSALVHWNFYEEFETMCEGLKAPEVEDLGDDLRFIFETLNEKYYPYTFDTFDVFIKNELKVVDYKDLHKLTGINANSSIFLMKAFNLDIYSDCEIQLYLFWD